MSKSRKLRVLAVYRLGANLRGRTWLVPAHLRRVRYGMLERELRVWPKHCGCGRSWTKVEWSTLHRVGVLDAGGERLELRQCACESTIAVPVVLS